MQPQPFVSQKKHGHLAAEQPFPAVYPLALLQKNLCIRVAVLNASASDTQQIWLLVGYRLITPALLQLGFITFDLPIPDAN